MSRKKFKQRLISFILVFVMMTGVMPKISLSVTATSSDFIMPISTPDPNAIKVYTVQDLINIKNNLNASYVLMNDIDLYIKWNSIGSDINPFTGIFDGNGFKIYGLKFDEDNVLNSRYNGLFGFISNATIKNLGLINTSIEIFNHFAGAITGYNDNGIIDNCFNIGDVYLLGDTHHAGGLVGYNTGKILNSYNKGLVGADFATGGITSYNEGIINNCFFSGTIDAVRSGGGITAVNEEGGTITNCYNMGKVYGNTWVMLHCFGGIAGRNNGSITQSYNSGSIISGAAYAYIGGIVGMTYGSIIDCYNIGSIETGSDDNRRSYYGGIAGIIDVISITSNCYSVGNLVIKDPSYIDYVGAFAGYIVKDFTSLSNNYCSGGRRYGELDETLDPAFITGKITSRTEAQMKNKSSFVGWDFNNVWDINPSVNNGYPFLRMSESGGNNSHRVNFDTDTWGFPNLENEIEKDYYMTLFSTVTGERNFKGSKIYATYKDDNAAGKGTCYGMTSTIAAINEKKPDIVSFTNSGISAKNLRIIEESKIDNYISNEIGMSILDFIKYGQLIQFSKDISEQIEKNRIKPNNCVKLENLYYAVKDFQNNMGKPVIIRIYNPNNKYEAHALYALRVEEDKDNCYIIVYDCNGHNDEDKILYKDKERKLILKKDNSGKFINWSYAYFHYWTWGSNEGSDISYSTPVNLLYSFAQGYGNKNRMINNPVMDNSLLLSSTYNLENILSSDIILPIQSSNGEISENKSRLYWVNDITSISLSSFNEPSEFSLVGNNSMVTANIAPSSIVNLTVLDDGNDRTEIISPASSNFTISHEFICKNNLENKVMLSGISNNNVKTLLSNNEIFFTGANNITITTGIDGAENSKSYPEISGNDFVKIELSDSGDIVNSGGHELSVQFANI